MRANFGGINFRINETPMSAIDMHSPTDMMRALYEVAGLSKG